MENNVTQKSVKFLNKRTAAKALKYEFILLDIFKKAFTLKALLLRSVGFQTPRYGAARLRKKENVQ